MTERRGWDSHRGAKRACHVSAALLLLGSFLVLGLGAGRPSSSTPIAQMARRETRPTLGPALFVGKAAASHRVAREMSCYTDGHAAT